jgi:hypothetical protein
VREAIQSEGQGALVSEVVIEEHHFHGFWIREIGGDAANFATGSQPAHTIYICGIAIDHSTTRPPWAEVLASTP